MGQSEIPDQIAVNIIEIQENANFVPLRLGTPEEALRYITEDIHNYTYPTQPIYQMGGATTLPVHCESHERRYRSTSINNTQCIYNNVHEHPNTPTTYQRSNYSTLNFNDQTTLSYPTINSNSQNINYTPYMFKNETNELQEFFPDLMANPQSNYIGGQQWNQQNQNYYPYESGMMEQIPLMMAPSMPVSTQTRSNNNTPMTIVTEPAEMSLVRRTSREKEERVCANCGTTVSVLWRWSIDNERVCNACGNYESKKGIRRPIHLRRDTIRRRKSRKPLN